MDARDQRHLRAILRPANDRVGPGPLHQIGTRETEVPPPHRPGFRESDGIERVRVLPRIVRFLAHWSPCLVASSGRQQRPPSDSGSYDRRLLSAPRKMPLMVADTSTVTSNDRPVSLFVKRIGRQA